MSHVAESEYFNLSPIAEVMTLMFDHYGFEFVAVAGVADNDAASEPKPDVTQIFYQGNLPFLCKFEE